MKPTTLSKAVGLSLLLAVSLLALSSGVLAAEPGQERDDGFFELLDENGRNLTMTVRVLTAGDGFIASDNRFYVVERVSGDKVYTRYKETVKLPSVTASSDSNREPASVGTWIAAQVRGLAARLTGRARDRGTFAIYVSHSDESYVPTSGTESESRGDVYNVARVLADSLRELGHRAVLSDASHLPRDGEAYLRSRRTAFDLLKRYQPDSIIDVHRDAVPAQVYRTTVGGREMVKVRLVVGRQNQNQDANLEYAKRIKAVADKRYPGLIGGIFFARGNYNQDLSPRSILLEIGTHMTSQSRAEEAAKLLARILPAAAGLTVGRERAAFGRPGMRSVWWIIGVGAVIALGLVLLNAERRKHIKGFFSREFTNTVGVPSEPERGDESGPNQKSGEERDGAGRNDETR